MKWIDTKEFELKQYISKGRALYSDHEYPKELCELSSFSPR